MYVRSGTKPQSKDVTEGIGKPKKKLLYCLKIMQQVGLAELAETMKISRMAVHRHLELLRERGLVESIEVRKGVGRPRECYIN
jgi:predicted ArsR family transcriptional regulator